MAKKSTSRSDIAKQIVETALGAMAQYVPGWIETLGKAGAPPGKYRGTFDGIQGNTRVAAAKEGMAFLGRYLEDADEATGQALLDELRQMGAFNVSDPGTSGDWPVDPELGGEAEDLG